MTATESVIRLARQHVAATEAYETAITAYMRGMKPGLTDAAFWAEVTRLRVEIGKSRKHHSGDVVKRACDEFVRRGLADAPTHAEEAAAWERLASFARTYSALVKRLSAALQDLPGLELGDDSFGDFCDCLPLAGQSLIERIFNGVFESAEQLEDAISTPTDGLGTDDVRLRFFQGEHYVRMMLDTELSRWFPLVHCEIGEEEL